MAGRNSAERALALRSEFTLKTIQFDAVISWALIRTPGAVVLLMSSVTARVHAQPPTIGSKPTMPTRIEAIVIHPIMNGSVFCSEHYAADGMGLGDALGS
ncbi:MAG: hypothetical protein ABJB74_00560 [Gemmatimonas sp.]